MWNSEALDRAVQALNIRAAEKRRDARQLDPQLRVRRGDLQHLVDQAAQARLRDAGRQRIDRRQVRIGLQSLGRIGGLAEDPAVHGADQLAPEAAYAGGLVPQVVIDRLGDGPQEEPLHRIGEVAPQERPRVLGAPARLARQPHEAAGMRPDVQQPAPGRRQACRE